MKIGHSMETINEKTEGKTFEEVLSHLKQIEKIEDKLRTSLDLMKELLSGKGAICFRDFFEIKRMTLSLFKEKIPSRVRTPLWAEYLELSTQAKSIKENLDEQSSFAQEQMDLAIVAMEKDVLDWKEIARNLLELEFPLSGTLVKNKELYIETQKELFFLTTLTEKIMALRKELIHLSLRIRYKNVFFVRLGDLANAVFPMKKAHTKKLCELFSQDIEGFVQSFHITPTSFFALKEEIRSMQSFAKQLKLDSSTFMKTREHLSKCWDKIREEEVAFRLQKAQQKELFKENFTKISSQLDLLHKQCLESTISLKLAFERVEAVQLALENEKLGYEELKLLKKRLFQIKKPLEEKEKLELQKQKQLDLFEEDQKKEAYEVLLTEARRVIDQAELLSLDSLVEKWQACVKERKMLSLAGIEQALLENCLENIADCIQEKKWQDLKQTEDVEAASLYHVFLDELHKARKKLKDTLEEYRKIVAGSTLSMDHALLYQDLIIEQRMRLDAIDIMIEEVEEKIFGA